VKKPHSLVRPLTKPIAVLGNALIYIVVLQIKPGMLLLLIYLL